MNLDSEAAREAIRGLRRKLDAAALEVLRSGMDWAEGPMVSKNPDAFKVLNIWERQPCEVEVRAGAIEPGSDAPAGWRVIRHADWLAAGRPGDIEWNAASPDAADAVRYAFAPRS